MKNQNNIEMETPRLFVAVCNSQEIVQADMMWSLLSNLIFTEYEVQVYRAGHPWDVVRNNQAIHSFLKSNMNIFVKMDVDQTYPPDYFVKMVPLVERHKVIGPVIYDRHASNDYKPLCFSQKENLLDHWIDISGCTGVMGYPYTHTNNFYAREVLEKCERPWYQAYLREDGLERDNHVDYDFLDRIKDMGYAINLNQDVVVKHLAYVGVDKEFYDAHKRGKK
jgi:hypothetical protein